MDDSEDVPRASDPIDDATPLSAARIDVPARIGWLVRTHRTVGGLSLRQMQAALRDQGVTISAATLSRVESEGQRPGAVLDGYTRALGLPDGLLRCGSDLLCRSFPYAPPAPPDAPTDLATFSRVCEAVTGPSPTAGAWLDLAHQHLPSTRYGLPSALMEPLLRRLTNEVGRGVASARFIRYDALAVLIRSEYGDLLREILEEVVSDPQNQNFYDLTNTLAEAATPEVMRWAGEMLRGPTLFHVRGASYMLQSMLVMGGLALSDWKGLVPQVRRAWTAAGGDRERIEVLAQLAGALPPSVQNLLREGHVEPAAPQPSVRWSRGRDNPHYSFAASVAGEASARCGHPDEPLLARLLFEAFYEPRGVRMSTAGWILAHSAFADDLVRVILDGLAACPDQASRAAALRVAALCHAGQPVVGVEALLNTGDPSDFVHATTIIGRSGQALPEDVLASGLAGDETVVRQTLYSLGMAGDPRLAGLAADASLPASVSGGAGWWLKEGPRIVR